MAHVLSGSRLMGTLRDRIVDADLPTIEFLRNIGVRTLINSDYPNTYKTVQLLDATSSIIDCGHLDKSEASGAIRLEVRQVDVRMQEDDDLTRWSYTMVTFSTFPWRLNSSSKSRSWVRILKPKTPSTLLGFGAWP